jgi:TRAP-type C4-dicarboxylate transport system substrate-binding protein
VLTTGRLSHSNSCVDVQKPQDLAGLTVTGGSIWEPLAQGLGMEPVGIPIPEFYSAMERGVVKVAATAPDNFASMKFWEVAPYTIYPPFGSVGTALVMNPDKWNSIPPALQDELTAAVFKTLPTILDKSVKNHAAVRQVIADNGVKSITFTGADADWYHKQIYDALTAYYIEKSPDDAAKLLELWSKK